MQALMKVGFLIVLPLSALVFGQNTGDAATKERQRRRGMLIEQILADAPNLRLGENRAIVLSKAGNMIWDSDQKRARSLFQSAVNELVAAQMLAEANKKTAVYQNDLLTGGSSRQQILNTIASRDAELALDLLAKSRPAAIIKALSTPTVKSSKITNSPGNASSLVQNEFNLEQSFMRMAADQNAERAAALLKESLSKGISSETLNLLKKLAEKDAETASGLASSFVDKLIQSKYTVDNQPNYQVFQIAVAFLNDFIVGKAASAQALKFDDSQMHMLADKLISYSLEPNVENGNYFSYSLIPIAEKLSPSAVEGLKRVGKNGSRRSFSYEYDPEVQKLLTSDATADQLLAEVKKYSGYSQRQIYQTAANKLVQQGDMSRATEILNDNFSDDALEEALRNLNWQYSSNLISSGKFAEAERVIDEMPENSRTSQLTSLANAVYQKDTVENKSAALAILGKARALISDKPENTTEMSNLMQVINAYATIEPADAFRMYEQLVPQMNELSDAAAIINGFQGGSNIHDGEYVLNQGYSFGFYGAEYSQLRTLAASDFERTVRLIDSFNRQEIRLSLKIQMAEGL